MSDLFDYLTWRGDLSFEQVPFGPVDGLILSTMCYVRLLGIVPSRPDKSVSIKQAARSFLSLPLKEQEEKVRVKQDIDLMASLVESPRFADLMLSGYTDYLEDEEETQFAVVAVRLSAEETFVAYRGTDHTLAGWKEDFNLSFQDTVPAQRFAKEYLEDLSRWIPGNFIVGGHSKGGNLAIYASAMCSSKVRDRVKAVYSYDGLGFGENVLNDKGYCELIPRLHSFLPESSVVGIVKEFRIHHIVVKSSALGVLQHNQYSWLIQGNYFIQTDERSESSHVVEEAVKNWSAGLSQENRKELVETVYDVIQTTEAEKVDELIHPRNILRMCREIRKNSQRGRMVKDMIGELIKTIFRTARNRKKKDD